MLYVVDASVAVKWLFPEPQTPQADALLSAPANLIAPDILWAEVASAACKKVRRNEIASDMASQMLDDFNHIPIKINSSRSLMRFAWETALEIGISVYDALYVALAYQKDCSLITADRKLYEKIRRVHPKSETVWLENFRKR
jgi:predicted nucleic acid-binding protein